MSADGMETAARWVSFELAGQRYALPILDVQEVLNIAMIEPVPGAPEGVLGVLNLRGSIVTVLDLRHRLGLPPQPDGGSILVATCRNETIGLRIDRVADVLTIVAGTIQPPPPSPGGGQPALPCGLVNGREQVLTLLDAARLLPPSV